MTRLGYVLAVCVLASPAAPAAQGTGSGPVNTAPGSAPAIERRGSDVPSLSFRQFGAWLDDASLEERGAGRFSIGAGYWRTLDGRQIDAPTIDAAYGLSERVQISAFVPFYHSTFSGERTTGVDDVYVSAKAAIVTAGPRDRRLRVAISPALEILGSRFAADRLHWALPLAVETRAGRMRLFASGGYFSRGAAFGGAAIEWTTDAGVVVWSSFTDSYALETGTDTALSAGERQRVDLAAGVAKAISQRLSVHLSAGRTLSDISAGGVSVGLAGGMTIRFDRRATTS